MELLLGCDCVPRMLQACHLPRGKRYAAVGQKGATLWMTGLSGSGKSTIAQALEEELVLRSGKHVYRLDGDNIRTGLNRDLGEGVGGEHSAALSWPGDGVPGV